jgi:hypothetical protein
MPPSNTVCFRAKFCFTLSLNKHETKATTPIRRAMNEAVLSSSEIIAALKEQIQGAVKVVPEINAASPAEIEKLQLPDGARKRRYFVDLRD